MSTFSRAAEARADLRRAEKNGTEMEVERARRAYAFALRDLKQVVEAGFAHLGAERYSWMTRPLIDGDVDEHAEEHLSEEAWEEARAAAEQGAAEVFARELSEAQWDRLRRWKRRGGQYWSRGSWRRKVWAAGERLGLV